MAAIREPPEYWYGETPVPVAARLLEAVYRPLAGLRRGAYRRGLLRVRRAPVPVVVVGNLTAGGTGKTPLAIALIERLRQAGWTPGLASRGHGRREAAHPRWVEATTDPALGGDEPVLVARLAGVPVRVDRDRVAAARALAEAGCDVVVCDDGLQHYRLGRDVEIEVVDGARRYGNGRMLPAGPLREPVERGSGCDFRVVNLGVDAGPPRDGGAEAAPTGGFGYWPMRLVTGSARPLAGGRDRPLSAFAGQRVHAVAGIGNPGRFFDTLRAAGLAVVPHAFPDHHHYQPADFAFASTLPVLMTEKDAVKAAGLAGPDGWSVPVRAQLPEAFWVSLTDRIAQARRRA